MDKLDQFKISVQEFLCHKEKNVLVIKGPWGVGKTYFWNNFMDTVSCENQKMYSYVSLFGLSTLSEIQSTIFYNSSKIGNKGGLDTVKIGLKKITKYSKKIPKIDKFSEAVNILEKSLIKNYLICIDDIERKNNELSISVLLGLISELSTKNECKFILIFNDDTLEKKDRTEFNKYREKVIDRELEYNPPVEHNQEVVFINHPHKEVIYKTLYPLNLKNIRILKHIKWNIENFLAELKNFEKEVIHEIIATTTILTYIHHEPSIQVSVEDLESIFSYRIELTEEQKQQQKTIRSFGYSHFSDYEKELVKYIADGVYDKKEFMVEIKKLNDRQKQSNFQKELEDVWGLFNNNFKATTGDVVSGLSDFLEKHVEQMSYREIEPMVSVINKLDNGVKTERWVDRFISGKIETLSRKDIEFFKTITKNTELLKQLEKRENQIFSSNSIKDTLHQIVKNRGWNHEDEGFLNSHSEEQLFEWLKSEEDSNFLSILRESLKIFTPQEGDTDKAQFGTKLHKAILRLAERSPVDKIRLKDFFGFEIEE